MSAPAGPPRVFEPAYYERLYRVEESHWWSRGMRRAMAALLRDPLADRGGLRILDVGCGTGLLLDELARLDGAAEASEPVGVDLSTHALAFCALRGNRRLARASAAALPFADGIFDLAVCIDTFQHLAPAGADRRAAEELARVLAPGGVVYLRTNAAWGHPRLEGADRNLYRRYRPEEVEELLDSAGLEVLRSTHLNALPSLWAAARELLTAERGPGGRSERVPPEGPGLTIEPYPAGRRWLGALLYGVLAFEAALVGRGLDLPFGHSTALVARRGE